MSQAVQLAKRDLKKQKEKQLEAAEKHGKATGKMATNKDGKKGHTEIIRTSHYNERLKKREERKKQERDRVSRKRICNYLHFITLLIKFVIILVIGVCLCESL